VDKSSGSWSDPYYRPSRVLTPSAVTTLFLTAVFSLYPPRDRKREGGCQIVRSYGVEFWAGPRGGAF